MVAWGLVAPETNLCRGSTKQSFFSFNMQNTLPWLFLIIYTSSVIFIYPLLKSFNRKNRKCKHYIHIFIFAEISGDKISHIGECSEVFWGSAVRSQIGREEIKWYTSKIHSLRNQSYFLDVFSWSPEVNFYANANNFLRYVTIICYSTAVTAGSRFRYCHKKLSFNYGYASHKKSIKHSLNVPCQSMKTTHFTHFTHLVFLLHCP